MRIKILRSFIFIMSLFTLVFILASCDNSNNDNSKNISDNSISLSNTDTNTNTNTTTEEAENTYTITWKNYDGEVLKTDTNVKEGVKPEYNGSTPTKPNDKEYKYTFVGWTPIIENVSADATYVALYDKEYIEYTISFVNEGVTIQSNKYHYGEEVIAPANPTKDADAKYSYTFAGWDSDVVKCDGDKTYTATYTSTIRQYNVTFVDENETTILKEAVLYDYGTKVEDIAKPKDPTKSSDNTYTYEFEGWTPEISDVTENVTYKAKYKATYIDYAVALTSNIDGAGTLTGAGKYHYDDTVTITAEPSSGYAFLGWYNGEDLYKEDASFTQSIKSAITLEARFEYIKFKITIDDKSVLFITGITSGEEYELGTEITLTANLISGCHVVSWEIKGEVVNVGPTYTFKVPKEELTIVAYETRVYTRDDNKIYFGSYPQTNVKATKSNGLLDITFDASTWISYKYYVDSKETDFMYYKDFDMDNDGAYDYRAVYFSQYRPYYYSRSSTTGNTHQDENGYATNTVHWFKYEPVEWRIINESDGKALIVANLILDSQDWYPYDSEESFTHNGGDGYVNNYELSNIRKWLNDNFYNTIFTDLQKTIIEKIINDDNIFLLSKDEVDNANELELQAKGTDYAKCQGLDVSKTENYQGNSCWWLRSPSSSIILNARCIDETGDIYGSRVFLTYYGIRPACWINLV